MSTQLSQGFSHFSVTLQPAIHLGTKLTLPQRENDVPFIRSTNLSTGPSNALRLWRLDFLGLPGTNLVLENARILCKKSPLISEVYVQTFFNLTLPMLRLLFKCFSKIFAFLSFG